MSFPETVKLAAKTVPIFVDTSLCEWCTAGHGSGRFERALETSIDCVSPYEINW